MSHLTIGVLALQGAFAKHEKILTSIGVRSIQVRNPQELQHCQGLIIPGGESTTIHRLMQQVELDKAISDFSQHSPIFGTCAGVILMAKRIVGSPFQALDILPIEVERNAYGRQIHSFSKSQPSSIGEIDACFIRAPQILSVATTVEVIASHAGLPILVRYGKHLGATFHPELTNNTRIHTYFCEIAHEEIEKRRTLTA